MATSYNDIVKQISIKQFMPIYVLMGDEPYYIDALTDLISASVLTDDEKIMNESVIYGKDANIQDILSNARLMPMMAPYRVIFLKEAQLMRNKDKELELLEKYLESPTSTTIVVITYKGGKIDARKKWLKQADKLGVVYTSMALRDWELPPVIEKMADNHGLDIDDTSKNILVEYVGSDLRRIDGIMQQFDILLPKGSRTITADSIEKVVGVSKKYNSFELSNAVLDKDTRKTTLIINHISDDIALIVPVLYNQFSNLLIYQYFPDKNNKDAVAAALKCNPNAVWSYQKAAKKYTAMQVFRAIGYLRSLDIKSKGVECADSTNTKGLLKETLFRIMH